MGFALGRAIPSWSREDSTLPTQHSKQENQTQGMRSSCRGGFSLSRWDFPSPGRIFPLQVGFLSLRDRDEQQAGLGGAFGSALGIPQGFGGWFWSCQGLCKQQLQDFPLLGAGNPPGMPREVLEWDQGFRQEKNGNKLHKDEGSAAPPHKNRLLGEEVLEELVHGPGDGRGGHLVNDPSLDASEEAGNPSQLVNGAEGVGHARQVPLDLEGAQGRVLLRVEQRLAHVQGRGGGGGHGSGHGAGHDVGLGVVVAVGVQVLLHELVGDEVDGLEGHVHGQLRGVAAVEGSKALSPLHRPHAAQH
ncbi:hypothetical protein DV515_00015912 [Chloebia gouldiae]|uniref:Uncharacterized protein n=1 Tax=Chloebia gouldiae TaxID=44316 RepID=A0A3L8RTV9_CHLGU|nr:hypothetical protein DV515_00015912 [Chloebia gouldiae]